MRQAPRPIHARAITFRMEFSIRFIGASLPCPRPCPDHDAQAGAVNERQVRQVRDDMRVTGHGLREHRAEVRGVSDV